ncbi:hypothetical protein AAG570_013203 [Ranatra chinensis]|uniref:SWIM-type domain-containing protein n=1 Tax=Ranatra chinensis TaxID=642074 RepID=A0ABD0YG48_9HEMI
MRVGSPSSPYNLEEDKQYRVSVSFDRCKITTVNCSCETRDIFWCEHVVALSLFRIRNAESIRLRMPISETLLQMDRQQLQKFVQYLIAEHCTEVLPTAQKLADEILHPRSEINQIPGAPDPTAGASADDEHSWHLDEEQVSEQVKAYLSQGSYYDSNKQLNSLFAKVKEMLRARDSNGARMLTLITEQFLSDPRLVLWKSQGAPMVTTYRELWDQLVALWVCVILNPHCNFNERLHWKQLLNKWSKVDVCPFEDPDYAPELSEAVENGHYSSDSSSDEEGGDERYIGPSSGSRRGTCVQVSQGYGSNPTAPRTIFHRAFDAANLSWDNMHLKNILSSDKYCSHIPDSSLISGSFNSQGQPLWHEPLPVCAARVDTLRSHGHQSAALRLAVAVVRTMKQQQLAAQRSWHESQQKCNYHALHQKSGDINQACTSRCGYSDHTRYYDYHYCPQRLSSCHRLQCSLRFHDNHRQSLTNRCVANTNCNVKQVDKSCENQASCSSQACACAMWADGWVGHPLDPIGCLFSTLAEASLMPDDQNSQPQPYFESVGVEETVLVAPPTYHHVPVVGSRDRSETYLNLAMEVALIGLGQQRFMPAGSFAQEKACQQEDALIAKIQELEMDNSLVAVLRRQAIVLLEGGPSSGLGIGIPDESVPMHTFARFLFLALLNYYPELAFEVGLRAMRLPVLAENEDTDNPFSGAFSRYPRWHCITHIETQQCVLASTMLSAAKGEMMRLRTVLESAQKHIRSSTSTFRLAQDASKFATPENGPRNVTMLNAAFELGLRLMRMTLSSLNWWRREMVRWLVTCAIDVGAEALISIMQNWYRLFTPTEATGLVATTIMSHSTLIKLNLSYAQQEELSGCARTLALQCATKDPPNCALNALTLCETDAMAFDAAYQIVVDVAPIFMTSSQMFTIARYMEHRGFPTRAYKLAMIALKTVHISYTQENNQSINDIHWSCALSHSLGKAELSTMIPLLVKNVHCAIVLSDVLRRCSVTAPGGIPCQHSSENGKHQHHHHHHHRHSNSSRVLVKPLSYDRQPLRQLLDAAISAFVDTAHSRLTHISPRHYGDFIEFLGKARDTFMLTQDGHVQFAQLIENMKLVYKGKKKLMLLVKERFG